MAVLISTTLHTLNAQKVYLMNCIKLYRIVSNQHINTTTNKDSLYGTGNSTLCSVITYMKKNLKKNMYICITDLLCCNKEI